MKPKQQRLMLAGVALFAIIGAGLLASMALKSEASFFYTPEEVKAATIEAGQAARLGGMVERGSLKRAADGVTISFRLTDGKAAVPVRFTGIVPDLFAEGAGAVADGRFDGQGVFVADTILAKHDERYMPPQMGKMPVEMRDSVVEPGGNAAATPAYGAKPQ